MNITLAPKTTFASYMDQVLYGPQGYYASGKAASGKEGDYFTAPDVGPVFGQLLARIFLKWQEKLGLPRFELVEAGAGEGVLAQSILKAEEFSYTAIERSPVRRRKLSPCTNVLADIRDLPPFTGCLFGNELLDAFPVHRVRMQQGRLQEGFVEAGAFLWDAPSTPRLAAYLDRIRVALPEGYETEINLAMADWFKGVAEKLVNGLILLMDYGRPAHEYYAPERDRGTLRAFRNHRVSGDVLSAPGLTDLTADVDFTSAALDARAAGLTPLAYMDLGSFLVQGLELLKGNYSALSAQHSALQYLLHPDGMGAAFHVLILGKDVALSDKDFPNNRLSRLGLTRY